VKSLTKLILRALSRSARPYLDAHGLLRVAKIYNKSAIEWQPSNERIVVLAPHMDDEVIGCGGSIARHIQCGSPVTVVFLTDGRRGGKSGGSPEQLAGVAATRKNEARLALGELGVTQTVYLDAEDGQLGATPELATALRRELQAVNPDIVYLPFFLEEHPDHRAASSLLAEAVRDTRLAFQCHGYEIWTPLFPNCLVKIDVTIDAKRRALAHYQSQLAEADYLHTALGLNAYRSSALLDPDCRFAEAFFSVSLRQYLQLFQAYSWGGPISGRSPA
jgi:LmbE family N-acetylglucosaminyl deacetylase